MLAIGTCFDYPQGKKVKVKVNVGHYLRPQFKSADAACLFLTAEDRCALFRAYRSTIVTTNKAFKDWSEVFPNAACVVSLVDRLVHRAEVISIEGESYRLKEARERNEARALQRKTHKPATKREVA
ncbi:ATP-binding protein [Candidatus Burkholderia verschuerenii]|uniref:ATP-binding protein n=1 Tax=Candidatus Burkholderia verschuerenii TaxID=242163 RepID=UPI000B0D5D16|nr:ATP-binding protein [Candidatus Burkholderia verschuerenii]